MRMIAHDRRTAARGRVVFTYQGDGNLVTRVAVENDAADPDHTFGAPPGRYRIALAALDADGREIDRTGTVREWIVRLRG